MSLDNLGARAILRVVAQCRKITREVRSVRWTIDEIDGALVDRTVSAVGPRFPAHYTDALVRHGWIRSRRIFWEITDAGRSAVESIA